MKENKFIVTDATDEICIGGFGNDLGNKSLLKYSEEEIGKMIIENNNTNDNVRLANSLLKTIRNQDNIIKEVREYIEELAEDTEDYIGAIDRRRKVELLEILDKVEENSK